MCGSCVWRPQCAGLPGVVLQATRPGVWSLPHQRVAVPLLHVMQGKDRLGRAGVAVSALPTAAVCSVL